MKQPAQNDHCANAKQPGKQAAPRAANIFAARAAALMLSFSYACSAYTPAQEPSAPARTARISSDQGNVGQWFFRRCGDSGYEFLNEDFGTSVFVGRSAVTIRRPSLSSGGYVESNLPLGEINIESVGASSPQSALTLTFPTLSGKFYEVTLSPGGESQDVRAFVRSR